MIMNDIDKDAIKVDFPGEIKENIVYDDTEYFLYQEFEQLYKDWVYSFGVSAFGCSDPAAKEPYAKLKEWCETNKNEAIKFIKKILEDEPNDIVMILQDLYGEEYLKFGGFIPLDKLCNVWLNILNCTFGKNGKLKDYYKDYRKWKKYLDKHYMSWRPNLENDPNVTQEEYKQGKRNKESNRSWHDFPLSILKDEELEELYENGYLSKNEQMKFIEELKPFYAKVKNELEKRKIEK